MRKKIMKVIGVLAVVLLLSIAMVGCVSADDSAVELEEPTVEEVEELNDCEIDNPGYAYVEQDNPIPLFASADPNQVNENTTIYLKTVGGQLKYSSDLEKWDTYTMDIGL